MPKPYGYTAKGKIEEFLKRIYPEGANLKKLAEEFKVKPQSVKSYLSEFKMNNIVTVQDNIFYWNPYENR